MSVTKAAETAEDLFLELTTEREKRDENWRKYNSSRHDITNLNRQLKLREAEITKAVIVESREAKVTATERDADMIIRIGNDEPYQSLQKQLDEEVEKRDDAEREMDLAKEAMRSIHRALAIHSGELYAGSV